MHKQPHTRSGYRQATYWLGVIIIGLTVGLGIQFAHAWTNPTGAPPTQIISGPLTTSADAQYKAGGLALGNGLSVSNVAGAFSAIFMADDESPSGGKYVHANSNVIGFTNGALNSWLSYWDNDGNQHTLGGANFASNIATNNLSTACPNGWGCGVHTWDVYAEGTILSAHDLIANGNLQVKGTNMYVGNNGNYFYGDGWNTAARQNGEFYVQHQNGTPATIIADGAKFVSNRAEFSQAGGEGAVLRLQGNNGESVHLENINGTFRILNNPWNRENMWMDQSGNTRFAGNFATNGFSTTCPNGWSCGMHTWDVYAEGSILSAHDIITNGNLQVRGNAMYVGNGGTYFYGDGTNTAARQDGAFYVQNKSGTANVNIIANDVLLTSINKWASTLGAPTGLVKAVGVSVNEINNAPGANGYAVCAQEPGHSWGNAAWLLACGNRTCIKRGYSGGHVVEWTPNDATLNCWN